MFTMNGKRIGWTKSRTEQSSPVVVLYGIQWLVLRYEVVVLEQACDGLPTIFWVATITTLCSAAQCNALTKQECIPVDTVIVLEREVLHHDVGYKRRSIKLLAWTRPLSTIWFTWGGCQLICCRDMTITKTPARDKLWGERFSIPSGLLEGYEPVYSSRQATQARTSRKEVERI